MHGGKNVKFKQFQFLKNEAIKKLTALEEEPLRLRNRTVEECLSADAVMLAYIGDAVYSMYVRERVVQMNITKVQVLHTIVTEFICAKSQAKVLLSIEDTFTEQELDELEIVMSMYQRAVLFKNIAVVRHLKLY